MKNSEHQSNIEEWEFSEEEDIKTEPSFTRQERRWIALGALKSALLIGAVYLIAAALLIWLMLVVWT